MIGSALPLEAREIDTLVNVLGLLHPGANAEWQFSNDKGETPEPLGLHIGDTEGKLDIVLERSNASWIATIGAWCFPSPATILYAATAGALAMKVATAAAMQLQTLATQAQFFIASM